MHSIREVFRGIHRTLKFCDVGLDRVFVDGGVLGGGERGAEEKSRGDGEELFHGEVLSWHS